jgi:hypothetical protein
VSFPGNVYDTTLASMREHLRAVDLVIASIAAGDHDRAALAAAQGYCGNSSSIWVIATIFADGHSSLSDIADVSEVLIRPKTTFAPFYCYVCLYRPNTLLSYLIFS